MSAGKRDVTARFYPEIAAGGFSHADGTIEFYQRVNALLEPSFRVLDLGAGRGAWYQEDTSPYRRGLRDLRGKVASVVGCDPDEIVEENRSLDEALVMPDSGTIPLDSEAVDLVLADYVFEHVENPGAFTREIWRVLRPGGWVCARTPNKWGYPAIASRLVPNAAHVRLLQRAQPDRRPEDVFPTRFALNTMSAVKRHFPGQAWDHHSYYYEAEPAYHFGSVLAFGFMKAVNRLLPSVLASNLLIFLRRRHG